MNKYIITRPKDIVEVMILPRVSDGKYSFVNLTKGHICKCKFDTVSDALKDIDKYIQTGEVISYKEVR